MVPWYSTMERGIARTVREEAIQLHEGPVAAVDGVLLGPCGCVDGRSVDGNMIIKRTGILGALGEKGARY
jgi:hypothetical protein